MENEFTQEREGTLILDLNNSLILEEAQAGIYDLGLGLAIILKDSDNKFGIGHILNDIEIHLYSLLKDLNCSSPIKVTIIPGPSTPKSKINEVLTFFNNKHNYFHLQIEPEIISLENFLNKETNKIAFIFNKEKLEFLVPSEKEIKEHNERRFL